MTFGERLRMFRKQKNFSQVELSDLTGIPQTTISDFENDKYLPSVGNAQKLAKALGVTVSKLLGEKTG